VITDVEAGDACPERVAGKALTSGALYNIYPYSLP